MKSGESLVLYINIELQEQLWSNNKREKKHDFCRKNAKCETTTAKPTSHFTLPSFRQFSPPLDQIVTSDFVYFINRLAFWERLASLRE